jgi:hypothetical protein
MEVKILTAQSSKKDHKLAQMMPFLEGKSCEVELISMSRQTISAFATGITAQQF